MRQFIKRTLQKVNKLTPEQMQDLLSLAAEEIDRLETVLDSLSVGIMVLDTDHSLVLANKYARRFFSGNFSDQSREPVWKGIREEKIAEFLEKTLSARDKAEGREFDAEINGVQRLFSMSVWPLVQDRRVSGSLIYAEDITEKRSREARMRRMENLASLTTLAAGVAHEIKNPLGSLSIHVQLIQKTMDANKKLYFEAHPGEDPDAGRGPTEYFKLFDKYLAVVNEEIDRLNRIVVDFLFAVRPMDMQLRSGNINAVITAMAEFVSFELEEAGIKCVLDLQEDLPLIDFDERFMKQTFLNLIKNAIAAMPEGGKLTIKTEALDTEIRITLADTGIGIPGENLEKIFEPYYTTKDTGSGLGLTLVFKIIREHQGEIAVNSKPGEGSAFIITLPAPQKEQRLIGAPE
ncbi:MAG: PAS domain-containing protein [Treponema sp.]|jgi:PAS domain S-box-containing protein|nr:PAS domain-containing protein [Treponema sp.]